mgnify:CR=1 FL=1
MGSSRGDQLVVAGMSPNSLTSSNRVFDRIHRGTSFIVFIDGLIVLLLIWDLSSIISANFSILMLGLFGLVNFSIWNSYKSTKSWAYWPGSILILIAGVFFGIVALLNIYFLLMGNVGSLLFVFLTGWATLGSLRRFMYHFNPVYKIGYFNGESSSMDFQLEHGEMLAACPTCMAVLAIRPSMLSSSDKCPHCQASLIDPELAAKYGVVEEE